MAKVCIVVNKNWEVEPFLNALVNSELRPSALPFPQIINSPKDGNNKMEDPRAVIHFPDTELDAVIYCIQDLMYLGVEPDPLKQSSSSSAEKYRVLPPVLKWENPDLVIAVGTAGYPGETILNGSVVFGANFFLHDGHPGNHQSNLSHPDVGKILSSNANDSIFGLITNDFRNQVEPKFIKPPRNPAPYPVCFGSKVLTAISTINVTDYTEYNWVDAEAIEAYQKVAGKHKFPLGSSETTHGVIKISTDKPIIFVSAITDTPHNFDTEVTPTQNYVSSFNAGIAMGQFLCSINNFVKQGNKFGK